MGVVTPVGADSAGAGFQVGLPGLALLLAQDELFFQGRSLPRIWGEQAGRRGRAHLSPETMWQAASLPASGWGPEGWGRGGWSSRPH